GRPAEGHGPRELLRAPRGDEVALALVDVAGRELDAPRADEREAVVDLRPAERGEERLAASDERGRCAPVTGERLLPRRAGVAPAALLPLEEERLAAGREGVGDVVEERLGLGERDEVGLALDPGARDDDARRRVTTRRRRLLAGLARGRRRRLELDDRD